MLNVIFYFSLLLITYSSFSQKQIPVNGKFHEHFDNGNIKSEAVYKDGVRVGVYKEYYESGKLSSQKILNQEGVYTGRGRGFFESGQLKFEDKPKPNGDFVQTGYYKSGKKHFEVDYKKPEGKSWYIKTGRYIKFYESGQLYSKGQYIRWEMRGLWNSFYETGEKAWEIDYTNKEKHIIYTEYFKNGNVKTEGFVRGVVKEGIESRYDISGNLIWKGKYDNDRFHGKWEKINHEGKVEGYIKYAKGEKVTSKLVNEVIVPTDVPVLTMEEAAIFKGCQCIALRSERRACFSKRLDDILINKFNTNIGVSLGLKGAQQIQTNFSVDKEGNIIDINVDSDYEDLRQEAKRVLNLIPKMVRPGVQFGNRIKMTFTKPITFVIE